MRTGEGPVVLTEAHHALLFALLAQAVAERAGVERAEAIARSAVRQYGEERGQRMARRATARGQDLSMRSFLAMTEYRVHSPETTREAAREGWDERARVLRCAWLGAWRSSGLLPYGRWYCLEIDEAVARGFNPALKVEVLQTESHGAPCCEFLFHEAHRQVEGETSLVGPLPAVVLPWDFHAAHMLAVFSRVIERELGEEGARAVAAALERFARAAGEEALQAIRAAT